MNCKDGRRITKDFLNYIVDWVACEYTTKGHESFIYRITDENLYYILLDKGIERRLKKLLLKKIERKAKVTYEIEESPFEMPKGVIKIDIRGNKND